MLNKIRKAYRRWLLSQLEKVERHIYKNEKPQPQTRYKIGWACTNCNSELSSVGHAEVCQNCGTPTKYVTSVPDTIFVSRQELVENYCKALFIKSHDSLTWEFKESIGSRPSDVMRDYLETATKIVPDFDWGTCKLKRSNHNEST